MKTSKTQLKIQSYKKYTKHKVDKAGKKFHNANHSGNSKYKDQNKVF